jgi:hypothetical protein
VDPTNIISDGRRARRGRGGSTSAGARPKYSAQAKVDSDEDDW